MLEVDIEKIIPITEARDNLNQLVDSVSDSDDLVVITTNGKPSAILVGVHHLEKLTGMASNDLIPPTSPVIDSFDQSAVSSTQSAIDPATPAFGPEESNPTADGGTFLTPDTTDLPANPMPTDVSIATADDPFVFDDTLLPSDDQSLPPMSSLPAEPTPAANTFSAPTAGAGNMANDDFFTPLPTNPVESTPVENAVTPTLAPSAFDSPIPTSIPETNTPLPPTAFGTAPSPADAIDPLDGLDPNNISMSQTANISNSAMSTAAMSSPDDSIPFPIPPSTPAAPATPPLPPQAPLQQ